MMTKYFVRVQVADGSAAFNGCEIGRKYITGCTESREYAETHFGFGEYVAVHCEPGGVLAETRRAGFLN